MALMPSINLTGELTLPVLIGLCVFALVVTACAITLLNTLHKTDREFAFTLKPFHLGTHPRRTVDRRNEQMYAAALPRIEDLEVALVELVEADIGALERVSTDWFDFVCAGLATVLATGTDEDHRVAIWTDDESDPDFLKGLAYAGFDRNAAKYEKLPRETTVAGWVIKERQEHFVPDIDKCAIFRPRTHRPRYRCMVATPLGPDADPWAVMTVDAPKVNGLSEEQLALIRRFGSLASVGARITRKRKAPTTGTIDS
jgi:hypothetical protein